MSVNEVVGPARDLLPRLVARVRAEGPISVAAFMAEALFDPRAGAYATRDPLGAAGDFVTAPEISALFGEIVGAWCVQTWLDLGAPAPCHLIELGPGTGALMSDILRVGRLRPDFLSAVRLCLVEASPALRGVQAARLADAPAPAAWVASLDSAPAGAAIVLGNEFLDCLPIRQFIRWNGDWRERLVGLDPTAPDRLAFVTSGVDLPDADRIAAGLDDAEATDGDLVEWRPSFAPLCDALSARFSAAPGAALFIDYGPATREVGDTLQALRRHEKVEALATPGEADLTARVDFSDFACQARAAGLGVHGPVEQGAWLKGLGLEARAARLSASRPDRRATLARQVYRLTDETEMGRLFKAIALTRRDAAPPAGFGAAGGT